MPFLGDMLVPWRVYCKNEIHATKRHKYHIQICVSVVEPKLPPEVNGVWMVCFGGRVPDLQPPRCDWKPRVCRVYDKSSSNQVFISLRIQVSPKEGISPIILFWWWDWNPQSYSREVSGFLGILSFSESVGFPLTWLVLLNHPHWMLQHSLYTKHSPVTWKPPHLIRDKNRRELVVFHHWWPNYDIPPT